MNRDILVGTLSFESHSDDDYNLKLIMDVIDNAVLWSRRNVNPIQPGLGDHRDITVRTRVFSQREIGFEDCYLGGMVEFFDFSFGWRDDMDPISHIPSPDQVPL